MNTEQLVEALRKRGYLLDLSSQVICPDGTKYSARYWRRTDSDHGEWVYANTFEEVVRLATISVCERDGLGIWQDDEEAESKEWGWHVWSYGLLCGVGIIISIQILIEALRRYTQT